LSSIQLNLLKVTATDYLRAELGAQMRYGETGKTSAFPATDFWRDELRVQPLQSDTLWDQIRDKLRNQATDHLKFVLLRDVADSIENVRVRNALLRYLPSDYSLFDLVMFTEEKLLKIPNLGAKSLDAFKLEMINILNLQPADHAGRQAGLLSDSIYSELISDAKVVVDQDYDWPAVRRYVDSLLTSRQIEVLQAHYGRVGVDRTLAAIGARLGLTRERVRQIKHQASVKFSTYISAEVAARAFRDYALSKFATVGIAATSTALWTAPDDPRVVADDERWQLAWFEDMYGRDWYTRWMLASALHDNSGFQAIVGLTALSALVQFLRTYSYRPLNLEEALVIAQSGESSIKAYDLRVQIEKHPEIRLFTHGDLQIGHASWRWFDPQSARAHRLPEVSMAI
jgi:hypothetical protein